MTVSTKSKTITSVNVKPDIDMSDWSFDWKNESGLATQWYKKEGDLTYLRWPLIGPEKDQMRLNIDNCVVSSMGGRWSTLNYAVEGGYVKLCLDRQILVKLNDVWDKALTKVNGFTTNKVDVKSMILNGEELPRGCDCSNWDMDRDGHPTNNFNFTYAEIMCNVGKNQKFNSDDPKKMELVYVKGGKEVGVLDLEDWPSGDCPPASSCRFDISMTAMAKGSQQVEDLNWDTVTCVKFDISVCHRTYMRRFLPWFYEEMHLGGATSSRRFADASLDNDMFEAEVDCDQIFDVPNDGA